MKSWREYRFLLSFGGGFWSLLVPVENPWFFPNCHHSSKSSFQFDHEKHSTNHSLKTSPSPWKFPSDSVKMMFQMEKLPTNKLLFIALFDGFFLGKKSFSFIFDTTSNSIALINRWVPTCSVVAKRPWSFARFMGSKARFSMWWSSSQEWSPTWRMGPHLVSVVRITPMYFPHKTAM